MTNGKGEMLALGCDEAKELPRVHKGQLVKCWKCSGNHKAEEATGEDGLPLGIFFVVCPQDKKTRIVGIMGRLLPSPKTTGAQT